eukprot:6515326-Karenia_brevis.AAC.1
MAASMAFASARHGIQDRGWILMNPRPSMFGSGREKMTSSGSNLFFTAQSWGIVAMAAWQLLPRVRTMCGIQRTQG